MTTTEPKSIDTLAALRARFEPRTRGGLENQIQDYWRGRKWPITGSVRIGTRWIYTTWQDGGGADIDSEQTDRDLIPRVAPSSDADLKAAVIDMRDTLLAVQWSGMHIAIGGAQYAACPFCNSIFDTVTNEGHHTDDCRLMLALRRAEAVLE